MLVVSCGGNTGEGKTVLRRQRGSEVSGLSCPPGVMSHWSAGEVSFPEQELWGQQCKASGSYSRVLCCLETDPDHTVNLTVVSLAGDF